MKKHLLITASLLLTFNLYSYSQKLTENKKDEFTNHSVKRTSWEQLCSSSSANAHYSISMIDTSAYLDLKMMMNKVFAIDKDDQIMLKLDNGEFVKINCMEFKVTCNGCGAVGLAGSEAEGIAVSYPIDKAQFDKLKTHKVVKVRI